MKISPFITSLSLLLIAATTGCYTTAPITSLSDSALSQELYSLQIEQRRLERILVYGGTGYTSTHSNGVVISGVRYTNPTTYVTPNTHTIDELTMVEIRIQEINSEILRRSQMWYKAATPQTGYSNTTKSSSSPVYSTAYSRLFHRSECSKLSTEGGSLMSFPSKENAEKNGGKPCPECNP